MRRKKIPEGIDPNTWGMWVLWHEGLLPLADFDRVSIDDIDLATRAFSTLRTR